MICESRGMNGEAKSAAQPIIAGMPDIENNVSINFTLSLHCQDDG
jgi:hypothetical protein